VLSVAVYNHYKRLAWAGLIGNGEIDRTATRAPNPNSC